MIKHFRILVLFVAVLFAGSLISCDPSKKYIKEEEESIQNFVGSAGIQNFVLQPSGLYYSEVLEGTGIMAIVGDSAYVRYTGKFLNGNTFDTNINKPKPYGFIVGQNIRGFDEGITLMKAGGKAILLIPSTLGYGAIGSYGISGYTPLMFEIELIKVVPYQ
jgi:FKBP-type peptidyl-prolyl cis-trans isomerase FkpA